MKKMQRFVGLAMAFAMTLTNVVSMPVFAANEKVDITILATSDLHGRLYPWEYATDLPADNGLAKAATIIKTERAKNPNLILVDNGDTIESNMINLFNKDAESPMTKALSILGYDTWTLGNHEFNFGLDVLKTAIDTFKGTTISSNIVKDDGTTFVKPYTIKEIDGVKIALLGITTPHIPRWEASAPEHFAGLTFLDPLTTVQKHVNILKNEEKVDVIVGVFHIGKGSENYNPDMVDSAQAIAEKVQGIDAIVAGHAHDTFGTADKQVFWGDTIALEPASSGAYVGKINLTVEKQATGDYKVVAKSTDLISTKGVTPDQELLDAMKYVDERSKAAAYEVIGQSTGEFLPAEEVKGIPMAQVVDTAVVDLINTVQMHYSGAEISAAALFDSRSNLKKGELQFKDAALIYKYSNTLQAHKITGKNLKAYMEWSAAYYNTQQEGDVTISFDQNIRSYNYDMFSGVDYKVDIRKPAGERIVELTFKGEPIDDEKEYILAINNYRVGTLQSLKLLPTDGSSLVYDSVFSPTPEMQRLITRYIQEELGGTVSPVVDNNWAIVKNDYSELKGAKEAIELVNKGVLTLPKSEDGRTPNVKSINVLEDCTADELSTLASKMEVTIDTNAIPMPLTKGEAYAILAAAKPMETIDVQVIGFNDFHGALTTSSATDKNMGAAKFVQAIKEEIAKNPNTLVVSAGDSFNGTALSNLLYGKPVAEMFKEIGIKASALGNHEFDWGLDKIETWVQEMNAPFLAANIYDKATNKPISWAKPYIIEEVDGVKVAFIGLTTPETAYKTKPENVNDFEFLSPVEAAKTFVPQAKADGAQIVVLLTHIGTSQGKDGKITFEEGAEELTTIPGVSAIITGHSHMTVAGEVNGVAVVQGYYNGRSLSKLNFVVDKATKEILKVTASVDELYKRKADIKDDEKMAEIIANYLKDVSPILDEVVGETKLDMPHDRYALSTLGQWTADVMKQSADAQVAVTNGGGLRTSIMAGPITMGKLYEVMPFDNVLSIFNMTGAQLKEVFEQGIENKEIGWVQFSGITVEYVSGAEKGSKVVKMTLDNGEVVDMNKTYRVVTNDFMATGGDGFTSFLQAEYLGDTVAIRDCMVAALKEAKVLNYTPKAIAIPVIGQTTQPIVPLTPPTTGETGTYVVKEGDVLWKIAAQYGITYQELAKLNNLKNPNFIMIGQKLVVPAKQDVKKAS